MKNFINLKKDTNVIYLFFMWTAANCIPNRDGITGDIRTESGRCVVSRESFNQNIKNGLAISNMIAPLPGCELLSVKNAYSESLSLAQAQKSLMSRIALSIGCKPEELTPEDIFMYCFDIPLFGTVNSDGVNKGEKKNKISYPAFSFSSVTGSAGTLFDPKTITNVKFDSQGKSNVFGKEGNTMSGSNVKNYLVEGIFACIAQINVLQLKQIAEVIFGIEDEDKIHSRIEELCNLYCHGLWSGYKQLGYCSSARKGQQPYMLKAIQKDNWVVTSDPAKLLVEDNGKPLYHDNIENTVCKFMDKSQDWFNNIGGDWTEYVE